MTNFVQMANDANAVTEMVASVIVEERRRYGAVLAAALRDRSYTYGVSSARLWLAGLLDPSSGALIPGRREASAASVINVRASLTWGARLGYGRMIEEANRQGVATGLALTLEPSPDLLRELEASAARAVREPIATLTQRVADATNSPQARQSPEAFHRTVTDTIVNAPEAGVRTDFARVASVQAQQAGRGQAMLDLPPPDRCYASEILDHRTCYDCGSVDGTEYATLLDGFVDYPLALGGGYWNCSGGTRCRGTLVCVYPEIDTV